MPQRTLQAKLFFVAATEIRAGRGTSSPPLQTLLQAGHSSLPQRRLESDAEGRRRYYKRCCCRRAILSRSYDGAASIPKSGPEIKNRCTQECINRQNPTSILKSGPEIKNRCTKERVNGENLASIPKSGPEIKNRCSARLKNRCSTMESALCRGRGMPDGQGLRTA